MIKLHLKSAVAILIILFIILIPGLSLSQKKDQSPQKDQVSAKRDLAARKLTRQEALVKNWQGEVQRIRELEAKKERVVAEEAKKLAVDLPPVIQKQLDVNIELGKMLEKFTAQEAEIVQNLERRKTRLNELEEESTLAREQVRYPLQTETIALALREHRRGLPSIENFHQGSTKRQVQMGDIRSKQLELDRWQRELAELDQTIERIIQGESSLPGTEIGLLKKNQTCAPFPERERSMA